MQAAVGVRYRKDRKERKENSTQKETRPREESIAAHASD